MLALGQVPRHGPVCSENKVHPDLPEASDKIHCLCTQLSYRESGESGKGPGMLRRSQDPPDTTVLSPYLKFGCVACRICRQPAGAGHSSFQNTSALEVSIREFYYGLKKVQTLRYGITDAADAMSSLDPWPWVP